MAWFGINETKYLCHCIKQLKKLASGPQPEKNVHTYSTFSSWKFCWEVGRGLGHLSAISGQRAAFPEQSFAASCLLPRSVDKWPLYVGLAVAAMGERASGLRIPGHPGRVVTCSVVPARFLCGALCGVHVAVFRGSLGRNTAAGCDSTGWLQCGAGSLQGRATQLTGVTVAQNHPPQRFRWLHTPC